MFYRGLRGISARLRLQAGTNSEAAILPVENTALIRSEYELEED